MKLPSKVMPAALIAATCVALLAVGYGIRTHGIAVRGWDAALAAQKELAELERPKAATAKDSDLAHMPSRAQWLQMVGLDQATDMQLAMNMTTYIHRHVDLGPGNVGGTISQRFYNALARGGEEGYCGDLSTFLRAALAAIEIPARTVQLATDAYRTGRDPNATHVTVEALIDGRWHVFDPTFNVTLTCGSDEAVDISQARQCVLAKGDFSADQMPRTLKGRSIAANPIPFDQYLQNYMRADTRVGGISIKYSGAPSNSWTSEARKLYLD